MVSRFSQKSNSSASKPAKPTYRRAPSPQRPIAKRSASPKPSANRPSLASRPSGNVKSGPASPKVHIPASKMPPAARRRTGAGAGARPSRVQLRKPVLKPKPSARVQKRVAAPAAPSEPRRPVRKPVAPKLPSVKISRNVIFLLLGVCLLLAAGGAVLINSSLFDASEIVVQGSDHLPKKVAEQLIEVPKNTTLFNVDEQKIAESLQANPWIEGVDVKREFPHRLVVTPRERVAKVIVYIPADDVAWAVSEKGVWIAPVSLIAGVSAEGKPVGPDPKTGQLPEGATMLEGLDAALAAAKMAHALLLTDAPSDVNPKGGKEVTSKVVLAGLEYAKGFSVKFLEQIKDLSIPSVEAISANLNNGVEVSLGAADNIAEKERVVMGLLEKESGVTYVNVRKPGAYTFRSAPL